MDHQQSRRAAENPFSGTGGNAWVALQALIDGLFQPLEDLLVEGLAPGTASVLDIGCGTGSTTVAAARRVGANGRCTGIDISLPMIDAARDRAEKDGTAANFIVADAQDHPFEPASFDAFISRFGVMFGFADRGRVRGFLEASSWSSIDIQPIDVPCSMPESELLGYLSQPWSLA